MTAQTRTPFRLQQRYSFRDDQKKIKTHHPPCLRSSLLEYIITGDEIKLTWHGLATQLGDAGYRVPKTGRDDAVMTKWRPNNQGQVPGTPLIVEHFKQITDRHSSRMGGHPYRNRQL